MTEHSNNTSSDDRRRVLFVDDESKVLDAHRRSFRSVADRWDIVFANSGPEALEIMAHGPVDVVVSDLAMPGMNGLQLAGEIGRLYPSTRFIMLTGTADMQSAIDAINEADVFRFYLKPSSKDDLIRGISDAIDATAASASADQPLDLGKAALNSLPYGVVVVDEEAQVLFANAFATELMGSKNGLTVGHDRVLRAERTSDTAVLHASIAKATEDSPEDVDSALFVEREAFDKPLYCLVRTFLEKGDGADALRHAVVFVTDPSRAPRISEATLVGLFDLSPSEARLLSCLVASGHLDIAAEQSGLTISTARTYLKQIFAKTETGKQGELIQMVLLSPAVLRQGD